MFLPKKKSWSNSSSSVLVLPNALYLLVLRR